jgi:hypothetical protein
MTNALEHPFQINHPMSYGDFKNEPQSCPDIEYLSNGAGIYNVQNNNPIIAPNNMEYPVTVLDPSPTESYVSTPTALYIPNTIPDNTGEMFFTETPGPYPCIEEYSGNYFQMDKNLSAPLPHVHPSWLQISPSWSVPVTPSAEINSVQFMSVPVSPAWKNNSSYAPVPTQQASSVGPCATFPASVDESMIYSQESSATPLSQNTYSSSAYNYSSDEFSRDTDEESARASTPDETDDEYVLDEVVDEENDSLEKRRQSKRAKKMRSGHHTAAKSKTQLKKSTRGTSKNPTTNKEHSPARRTATSYDWKTTLYLKSVFYEAYSIRDKLTKDQRREVQKVTGLKPRSITYWFSNHKRRLTNARQKFREARRRGIKTYQEFINWRISQGLPEEVQPDE